MTQEPENRFNVVVAFDFSESSELAFVEAIRLARGQPGAHVFVLCVGSHAGEGHLSLDLEGRVAVLGEPAAVALLKLHLAPRTAKKSDEAHGEPEITYQVRAGDAAAEIVELARTVNAELIIMGTHGRRGLKRAVLGSVAEQVLRHAECAVLVVRERAHEDDSRGHSIAPTAMSG